MLVPEIYGARHVNFQLTARDASSAVENATNPEPLLIPLGSRMTYVRLKKRKSKKICHLYHDQTLQ